MDRADLISISAVGGDEAGDRDDSGVGEEFGDLSDSADVLFAVVSGESEVVIESVSDIVAVESVGEAASIDEGMLESDGDGGFA